MTHDDDYFVINFSHSWNDVLVYCLIGNYVD